MGGLSVVEALTAGTGVLPSGKLAVATGREVEVRVAAMGGPRATEEAPSVGC